MEDVPFVVVEDGVEDGVDDEDEGTVVPEADDDEVSLDGFEPGWPFAATKPWLTRTFTSTRRFSLRPLLVLLSATS